MAPRPHSTVTHKFHKRRGTIVRAAVDVLNHKGVRGMTLADVAAKIDVVPTAVMYYFHKKEELAAACFHKAIEQYQSIMAEALRARSAHEALETFIRGYFEFRRRVAAGEADQIAVYNDVRAVRDPGVALAYTQMFRNARSLLLKSPEVANLARLDCNARTHLLLPFARVGLVEVTTGVPVTEVSSAWDALAGWQRGVLGILIVALAFALMMVGIALFA
jgi:AcrR family transcriptional regulator